MTAPQFGEPWATYPNPMRADGVFVGEDAPQTFYHPGGQPEAVPRGAWRIGTQIEPRRAERIVACVNALAGVVHPQQLGDLLSAIDDIRTTGSGLAHGEGYAERLRIIWAHYAALTDDAEVGA